jgi:hypothetical protein
MTRILSCFLGASSLIMASCTIIRNRGAFDEVMATPPSGSSKEMRSDGYFWKKKVWEDNGRKWLGVYPILFLPGGIVLTMPVTPGIYESEKDTAADSLNTFERAHRNLQANLPDYLGHANKESLDGWGHYRFDGREINIGVLSYEGIGLPFFSQSYGAFSKRGVLLSETELRLDTSMFFFEKYPVPSDTSGIRINESKFRQKRFPRFFWGW